MKNMSVQKREKRARRHARIRAKVSGTAQRPRISVFKSSKHIFVQVIDDTVGRTIVSSKAASVARLRSKGTKTEYARKIGEMIAEKMKERGVTRAVFDTGGSKYHGRVQAVAEGLRAGGITI